MAKKVTSYNNVPADQQEAIRLDVVKRVKSGEKQAAVAHQFGVTRQAVNNWVRTHRRGGAKALKSKPRGRPRKKVGSGE